MTPIAVPMENASTTGTGNPGLVDPVGLATDSSGNLWTTDFGVDNIKAAGSNEGANHNGIPNEVVFDGQLYTKTSFSPANAFQGDHSFLVAVLEGEDDCDPEEKGPEYLVS